VLHAIPVERLKLRAEVKCPMERSGIKIIAKNSKAYHDYFVEERFEAGMSCSARK
jgi:hypothetical protein